MADATGRPDHINDVILRDYPQTESRKVNPFGWTPHKPHVYENLQKLSKEKKPTEKYLNAQLAQMQADFDAVAYKSKREEEYPRQGDQLDDLYKAGAFSPEMAAKIKAVKDKYPKP
jgi:hypothetical protein